MDEFAKRVDSREIIVGVVGLGYVGLPLAVAFANGGFTVIGFDVNAEKVVHVNRGENYIRDIKDDELKSAVSAGRLSGTGDFSLLSKCDAISICLPTPLSKMQEPDISYILAATREVAKSLKSGAIVILESTTYPGT